MSAPPRKVLTVDEDLADWIQEYLQYRGFTTTLDCFQAEYLSGSTQTRARRPVCPLAPPLDRGKPRDDCSCSRRATMNKILDAFDVGDAERFANCGRQIFRSMFDGKMHAFKAYFLARVHFVARAMAIEHNQASTGNKGDLQSLPGSPISPSRKLGIPMSLLGSWALKLYLEGEVVMWQGVSNRLSAILLCSM